MADRWRLFVAVPVGDELRARLAPAVERWRSRSDLAGLRWSDPASWHLTVLFLGSTDPDDVPAIAERLRAASAAHVPFRLATGGLGGFPSPARSRVAWYGVADAQRRLATLAGDVAAGLSPVDDPPRFRAHVTLARVRDGRETVDLRPWIAAAAPPEGTVPVDALHLMRSHTGRGPSRYESLAAVPIGERVGV